MVRISSALLAPLALAASAAAKTSLYLSPANNLAAPIAINAEEAHQILSQHIDVDGLSDKVAQAGGIWSHVLQEGKKGAVEVDQRAMVERLFDGHREEAQNRLLVLMHGSAHDGK